MELKIEALFEYIADDGIRNRELFENSISFPFVSKRKNVYHGYRSYANVKFSKCTGNETFSFFIRVSCLTRRVTFGSDMHFIFSEKITDTFINSHVKTFVAI